MMKKELMYYKQNGDTCTICCMLMVLVYYNIIDKITWYDERRYYRIYKSRYINGVPFSAILYHLSKKGLYTSIYHSESNLFSNNNIFTKNIYELLINEYKDFLTNAISIGSKVYRGINIDINLLIDKLNNNLIILAGMVDNVYHAIVLLEYSNDTFIIYDPLYGNKQNKTNEEINIFMNTNIGKWFIVVNNKNI